MPNFLYPVIQIKYHADVFNFNIYFLAGYLIDLSQILSYYFFNYFCLT